LATLKAAGASSVYDIEVTVEPAYEWSRIVIVGKPRAASSITERLRGAIRRAGNVLDRQRAVTAVESRGDAARDLQTIVRNVKQIEDDAFPEGWYLWGELRIDSGTLMLGDPRISPRP
jgi:hypothetical protein